MTVTATDRPRQVLYVVGSGRSGTSTLAGVLKMLGVSVPQPEIPADPSNPRGFGEPEWVVKFNQSLLARNLVHISDARPEVWDRNFELARDPEVAHRCQEWLETQFRTCGETLLIKDPRLVWFLPMWQDAARSVSAEPYHLIMLRPPTEVVGSKRTYYKDGHGSPSGLIAGWINVMLRTELETRREPRFFVEYEDLLENWSLPVSRFTERFGIHAILDASPQQRQEVDRFIDPGLRRIQTTWADLALPAPLEEMARETWRLMLELADTREARADLASDLDELRRAYDDYYQDSAAIAESSIRAARREGARAARARAREAMAESGHAPTVTPGTSMADRIARIVPHEVRARIPESLRRRIRRSLDRSGARA